MRTFVYLVICFAVASGNFLTENKNDGAVLEKKVAKCLIEYKIDPDVVLLGDEKNNDLYDKLTKEQRGCVTACFYRSLDWLKEDGSIDYQILTDGETPEDAARYIKIAEDCRAEAGNNHCKFFNCFEDKE